MKGLIECLVLIAIPYSAFAQELLSAEEILQPNQVTEQTVLTPTRLKQPLKEVPAAVTIIESQTIRSLGFTEIAEILRLVPGMAVGTASGNDYRVNYHGGNGLVPRRMQVLLDGMPIYQSGYAQVNWKTIGVNIRDIDRIEVTRGPSSAAYGANAFEAVINIISKSPETTQGVRAHQILGSENQHETYSSYGWKWADTAIRVSGSTRGDDGFDQNAKGNDRRDSSRFNYFNLNTRSNLPDDSLLDFHFGTVTGVAEVEFADSGQVSFPDINQRNYFLDTIWDKHTSVANEVKLQGSFFRTASYQGWNSCYPEFLETDQMRALALANPDLALELVHRIKPSGESSADMALYNAALTKIKSMGSNATANECGGINQDAVDQSGVFEAQDTYIINSNLRYVAGLGIRHNHFESETYVNGTVTNNDTYIFSNIEYKPNKFVFNIGANAEYKPQYTASIEIAPRFAVNYLIDPNQTVRFVVSKAYRTPDVLENERDWSYYVSNFTAPFDGKTSGYFFYRALSTDSLQSEKILSKEIGYLLNLPSQGATLDLKIYQEKLYDLNSEKLQFLDYHPTNNGWLDNKGAEVQINYKPIHDLTTGLSYSYQDSYTNNFYETMLYARNSGAIYAIYQLNPQWKLSAAYYSSSSIGGIAYDRLDIIVNKEFQMGSAGKLTAEFKAQRYAEQGGYIVDTKTTITNTYDKEMHYTAGLFYKY